MKHTVKHLRFPEAPVEAVTEFRQVTGQVLWADTMMDTTNIAFYIGDQGVDPRQGPSAPLSPNRERATHDGRAKHPGSYPTLCGRFARRSAKMVLGSQPTEFNLDKFPLL